MTAQIPYPLPHNCARIQWCLDTIVIGAGSAICAAKECLKQEASYGTAVVVSEGRMIATGTGDKVGPTLIIKPLTECSAGELFA